jgi:D-amino peptidase
MRIFISVDIEGVAGVGERQQGQRGNPEYEAARRLMVGEANAAVRGAFAGGASEVTVADSHGPMRNMPAAELDPRARLVTGSPRPLSMAAGLEPSHAGVVLIGWHGAASRPGVLAHTINGRAFARIEVNGVVAGEPTLFAGHAAELGVPLLAASGDDRLADEISEQFPATQRIVVKRALGAVAADSLSPGAAQALIEAEVAEAVRGARDRQPEAPCAPPLSVSVVFTRQVHADAAVLLPALRRENATTVSFEAPSHAEAIGVISALSLIVSGLGEA